MDTNETQLEKDKPQTSKGWFKENLTILLSLVLVIVMLLTVVSPLGLFTAHDAPFQLLAACLGAIVTVLITSLLLKSQAKQQHELQQEQAKTQEDLQNQSKRMELKQIKETEQYKAKLKIYQEYLVNLYEAVKDRELTTEEKIQMQFQTARLAMHTETGHIEQVSTSVKDIISCLTTPSSDKYDVEMLQKALFNIILQFREELYENNSVDDSNYSLIIQNFVDAFTPEGNDFNSEVDDDANTTMNNGIWQEAVEKWTEDDQWKILVDGETIRLYRPENSEIHVQFGFWRGHYYIQAKYHRFVDFSQALKWKYKGSKTYETWWNHLSSPEYYNLKEGEFWQTFSKNDPMQKTLVDWFEILMAFIEKWDKPANRFNELMKQTDRNSYEQKGWKFWIYDSCCVVCDSHNKDKGEPFIDTFDEEGKCVIRLGNRSNNVEVQKRILASIGLTEEKIREDGRTDYAVLEKDTSDIVIMEKVAELMKKLSN